MHCWFKWYSSENQYNKDNITYNSYNNNNSDRKPYNKKYNIFSKEDCYLTKDLDDK